MSKSNTTIKLKKKKKLLIIRGKKIEYFKVSLIDVSRELFCRRTRFMEYSVRGRDGNTSCVRQRQLYAESTGGPKTGRGG